MASAASTQYCLKWNNHRSNLLTVFDQLLKNEAFTDVTLACEGGAPMKCHKMVLAACSSYFQLLFTELPYKHTVVVLKDVTYIEMKALLEYMYKGEVNVAHDELAPLLRVAEALKVKGLVEDKKKENGGEDPGVISTSSSHPPPPPTSSHESPREVATSSNNDSSPHSTQHYNKVPSYLYGKSPADKSPSANRMSLPMWGMPGFQIPTPPPPPGVMLNNCYEAALSGRGSPNMSPLHRKKKLSNMLMNKDTPILRTVLGQGQADSSQPPHHPLPPGADPMEQSPRSNGSIGPEPPFYKKSDTSPEDVPSPYTDVSMMEDEINERNKLMLSSSQSPQSFYDGKGESSAVSSAIAVYVPPQKPEWKRYKQYTRTDILSAIEAVKNGMSALQAARKYGVPSRTLYDKVKKLGITTSRPFKRSSNNNNNSNSINYSYMYDRDNSRGEESNGMNYSINYGMNYGLPPENNFMQQALEWRERERELLERENNNNSNHNSLSPLNRSSDSPSPNHIKYAPRSPSPPPPHDDMEEDQVEDLSMGRKSSRPNTPSPPPSRVIMPPQTVLIKPEPCIDPVRD
ncbi:uncharacterized protein LOC103508670 isoform X1 [Diaphorina citri]|uniref:Uncharacterized protein LOC103508670 isoform X1 n=1 Tax=Diaphorina citri TaxID=121845 RepID=A0A3Q0IRW6_DIACI|nr:uncharacterized protein LOC103508670 isoform X1 [Diaphorina citri]XP_026679012.1 uncharacterized protein LOC103508670 isoform X2 [Diaphorina citri]XP_026679014.1 uncharacterized protein LOC103508670 isoform X1 [Diaphorina citri]KAI5732915.1 hypothetical protein M8J76_005651 [Diaphorina citri]KAI5733629.1 hypothetical protein M8J76_013995 [Diaphorina citri]KAI5739955.1 hypothetical protein M8J77_025534 [Diaphorina citri]